jgi:hypothetical protein
MLPSTSIDDEILKYIEQKNFEFFEEGCSPIHYAGIFRKVDLIEFYLEKNYSINSVSKTCCTPFLLYFKDKKDFEEKDIKMLILSLCYRANLELRTSEGENLICLIGKSHVPPQVKQIYFDYYDGVLWNPDRHNFFSSVLKKKIELILKCIKFYAKKNLIFKFPKYLNYIILQYIVTTLLQR